MIKIDLKDARRLLREAVAERGEDYIYSNPHNDLSKEDYVYGQYSSAGVADGPTCLYVHKDKEGNITPGCGVGLALINAGVSLEWFDSKNDGIVSEQAYDLREHGVADITPEAVEYLRLFQGQQDFKFTWGDSLRVAEQSLEDSE